MFKRNRTEPAEPVTLESLGIQTDGVVYQIENHVLRMQVGPLSDHRGPNGFTPEQLYVIVEDVKKRNG